MSNPAQSKLTSQARSEIRSYIWTLAKRGGVALGIVNLAAILGGYYYVVGFAADRASDRAGRLTEERLVQADVLQQALLEGVGQSLRDVGRVQAEITQIQENATKAEAAIETLTGVGPERLEALSNLIERTTAETDLARALQEAFDRLARVEDLIYSRRLSHPDNVEIGKIRKSESDGFVIVTAIGKHASSSVRIIEGLAGPRDPPRQRRAAISIAKAEGLGQSFSFNMPVLRDEYFLIKDSAGPSLITRSRDANSAISVDALFFGFELEE